MENSIPSILQCSSCNQDFEDPWDLMEHVHCPGIKFSSTIQDFNHIQAHIQYFAGHALHTLNFYELCDDNQNIAGHNVQ